MAEDSRRMHVRACVECRVFFSPADVPRPTLCEF